MAQSLETQTLQERVNCLKELTEFTENCKKQLDDTFRMLGWSADNSDWKQEDMEQCPYDPDHRVPARSMERHKAYCRRRKMGYTPEEQAAMYDPAVCYENNTVTTFIMDKPTQHQVILQARSAAPLMKMEGVFWQATAVSIREEIGSRKSCCSGSGLPDCMQYPLCRQYTGQPVDVPQNHKRAICDLTVADRVALYDHVVSVLSQQKEQAASSNNEDLYVDLVSKLRKGEDKNEPKTHLELMAEMRDYKRRRQSYRAKNVHITKKSYTEVIREVINVHSDELARQWKEEEEEEKEAKVSEVSSHRRRTDERRSASTESHHRSRRHRSRERSQNREGRKRRDSRSPEDHHHHDRKKKKKKKDDK